jgi:hypothetical protein
MNPNETTKASEFIFRRLGDSFPQFLTDFWGAVTLWLLIPAGALVIARIIYLQNYRKQHPHSKPDATSYYLGWASFLTVAALIAWVLIAFYQRDTKQERVDSVTQSTFAASNAALWYVLVAGVFAVGAVFVVLMYMRDHRSIRWYWATKLAILRIAVYAILCFVFLLPALQTKERFYKNSRVVVLVDITPSLTRVTDEVNSRGRKPKTRMEQLIEFLTDDNIKLLKNILSDNPVVIYPFGTRLDENPQTIGRNESSWGKAEWEAFARYDFRPFLLKGLSDAGKEALRNSNEWTRTDAGSVEWAAGWYARKDELNPVNGMLDPDTQILKENIAKLDRRIDVARTIALGTNVPDSVIAAVNRESPNMVEGIIVISDGRSNLGSDSSYRDLRNRSTSGRSTRVVKSPSASSNTMQDADEQRVSSDSPLITSGPDNVPIFTITVGEDRQTSSIIITDIQVDDTISPDEGSKVIVEADGINLANKSTDVELDIFYLGKEAKDNDLKGQTPNFTMSASTSPTKTPYRITFAPGDPPHGQVEFVIDPAKFAAHPQGVKLTEESSDTAIKKPVLKEGRWAVRARIPKHENEAFGELEHVRDRLGITVVRKKLRALLVAGAPNREFQFLRNFFVREVQENRAEVTILIQNEAGTTGNITPNPTEQIIGRFPTKLDLSGKTIDPKEKAYNLNEYDLIVAFDPDWTELSQQQAEDLQSWVERQGGGLIYVADRINTYQLARVEPTSRLSPLLEILPVIPDDVIAVKIRAIARTPRRLYLNPIPASDLLKIDGRDETKSGQPDDPIAGWERFFTDRDKYAPEPDEKVELHPKRGFFSCYPVRDVKPGAKVLAEFVDVDERGGKYLRPWLVLNSPSAGWRTCFVGSGEIYRMYAYDKEYYERYWAKLMKYMAAKRNVKASRGRILVSKEVISGTPIRVQAQILNTNSKPYPIEGAGKIEPKFTILQTSPSGEKKVFGPFELRPSEYESYYKGQVFADQKLFPPGDFEYAVLVDVPDSASEILQGKFQVVKSDPEMDNTKPDFVAMQMIASDFDETVQSRIKSESTKAKLVAGLPKENGMPKLAFKLSDTALLQLIPECFSPKSAHSDNKGPVEDLWDKGIEFPIKNPEGSFAERIVPDVLSGKKLLVSWVMLLVVFLLCWEWTTRKLLRLA